MTGRPEPGEPSDQRPNPVPWNDFGVPETPGQGSGPRTSEPSKPMRDLWGSPTGTGSTSAATAALPSTAPPSTALPTYSPPAAAFPADPLTTAVPTAPRFYSARPSNPVEAPSTAPLPTSPADYPWGSFHSPPSGHPVRPARRRLATVALVLVSALIGGGVVLAGDRFVARGISLGTAAPTPGAGGTSRPDGSIAKIAATALPSIVTVKITAAGGTGTGSGFVIDTHGHILTNNHVVAAAGGGGSITVELNNGTDLPATVVGTDESYDLAVIKIDTSDVPPLTFGRSADVVVGDGVIAVGAPLGLEETVTTGIVSALDRPVTPGTSDEARSYIDAIQTDAAINPGNSGGPLLDFSGRVIGVNSAIARVPGSSGDVSGNIGVGFAIPSDQAAKTAEQLIATGKAVHPVLGVNVDTTYTGEGAKIASDGVPSGSAAAKAGLQGGDVITAIDGRRVPDSDTLIVTVRSKSVGDSVHLTLSRGGQTSDVVIVLQGSSG